MTSILQLLPIAAGQYLFPQQLERTPEPDAVMDTQANVDDFDSIMNTNVSISLCGMIDLIGRLGFEKSSNVAIDLACGPGHFTLMLAKHFDFDRVIGVDLSNGMLQRAKNNAIAAGLEDRVEFVTGDATSLDQYGDSSFDLVTCTNSAHHLPTPELLANMLKEMDRVVHKDSLCAVMDLQRLKTAWTSERYVNAMGKEYKDQGLHRLYTDFNNSMLAAWTPQEMQKAAASSDQSIGRNWRHFSMAPLPINQFLFSKPCQPTKVQLGNFEWLSGHAPINAKYAGQYKMYLKAMLKSFKNHSLINFG